MHNTWEIIKDTGNAQPNAEFDLANREIREASIAAVQGTNFLSSSFYHIDSGSTRMKDQLIVNGVYSLSLSVNSIFYNLLSVNFALFDFYLCHSSEIGWQRSVAEHL